VGEGEGEGVWEGEGEGVWGRGRGRECGAKFLFCLVVLVVERL
jgi:hypothetical protein